MARPTHNPLYKQLSRNKIDLLSNCYRLAQEPDPEVRYVMPAFYLRYAFMVTASDVGNPPCPPEAMAQVRAFLQSSYEDPQREIALNCDQMAQLYDFSQHYRIYNADNAPLVMRHLDHPEETGAWRETIADDAVQRDVLTRVLALIPDAE